MGRRKPLAVDAGGDFTIIQLDMYPGRTVEMKREPLASLIRRLARWSISPNDVYLMMRELPKENWGIDGTLAVDV